MKDIIESLEAEIRALKAQIMVMESEMPITIPAEHKKALEEYKKSRNARPKGAELK